MKANKLKLIALTLSVAGLATACGGGGGDTPAVVMPPPPPSTVAGTDVPVSATQNVAGLTAFAKQQQGASSDTAEPLVLGDSTVLASDDSAEPSEI